MIIKVALGVLLALRYLLKFNLEYFTLIDKEYFRYYRGSQPPFVKCCFDEAKWREQNSSSLPLTLLRE